MRVVELLEEIAFGQSLLGQPMKARAFARAASIAAKLGDELPAAHASGELAEIPGIGKGLLATIGAAIAGQSVAAHDEVLAEVPAGVLALRHVRGLGPGRVRTLWRELGIDGREALARALADGRVAAIKGFGKARAAEIAAAIQEMSHTPPSRLRVDVAAGIASAACARLAEIPGLDRMSIVGDLARGEEDVAGVVLLARGDAGAERAARACLTDVSSDVPITLHVAPDDDSYGVLELIHTSHPDHWRALIDEARSVGFDLESTGLVRHGQRVSTPGAEQVYETLGLMPMPPERRQPGVVLWRKGAVRPRLVERRDLRGAIHNHTVASDGIHTLVEMRRAAAARDLEYLAITEHSQTSAFAGGLDALRLMAHAAQIRSHNDEPGREALLIAGIESDILADGSLDYPAELLATLDVVVISMHRRHQQDRETMTRRLVRAVADPHADILGHPTGRLLGERAPADFDVAAVLDACALNGVAVELNASPARFDLSREHLGLARERGILISIAADAHSTVALDNLDHGVRLARSAGLLVDEVLNARPWPELSAWVQSRRARHGAPSLTDGASLPS